jgi:hypothetical protein
MRSLLFTMVLSVSFGGILLAHLLPSVESSAYSLRDAQLERLNSVGLTVEQ